MTLPRVSIVIPAYNHADYLAKAIDSVLAQEYPELELIVLDDGSTDNTREILQRYRDRFHWETHPNMGQAATLNKGWALARGSLLGYLSADDYLLPGTVSAIVRAFEQNPAAMVVYGDFEMVDPAGRFVRHVRTRDWTMTEMLTRLACPPGPGALFRRSALQEAGGWNPQLRQMPDFDFWLRVALHGPLVRIAQPVAAWRVHEASQSFGAMSEARATEPVRIIEQIMAHPRLDPALLPLRARALARAHLVSAQLHARSGRYTHAIRMFTIACRLSPHTLLHPHTWRIALNVIAQRPVHRLLWMLRSFPRRPS